MRDISSEDIPILEAARRAASAAYCPYSKFPVGAVVETEQGTFSGCNIENASFGLTVCAERVAILTAIAAGARTLLRLSVSCPTAQESDFLAGRMPCGACRQVIAEFMPQGAEIIVDGGGVWRVDELLPQAFQLNRNRAGSADA